MSETTAVEIPKINVNLAPCNPKYPTAIAAHSDGEHPIGCPGAPVLVPLPLDTWRTVTMKVRLGECDCADRSQAPHGPPAFLHAATCPARPIEVICSIQGETWEESEVAECNAADALSGDALWAVIRAVEDRWACVKALVMGLSDMCSPIIGQRVLELRQQRDAVFAALVRMKRAAEDYNACNNELDAMPINWGKDHYPRVAGCAQRLYFYANHLIKQVGELA